VTSQTLLKAIHLKPSNQTLWFNLAIAREHEARLVLQSARPTSAQISGAMKDLSQAQRTLEQLCTHSC
jgi:hypothetical protein